MKKFLLLLLTLFIQTLPVFAAYDDIIVSGGLKYQVLYGENDVYLAGFAELPTEPIEITVPASITDAGTGKTYPVVSIGYDFKSSPFEGSTLLKKVTIEGEILKRIFDSAFKGCTNLESINIPNSVTYIGSNAFQNCQNLTSIVLPDNLNKIGKNAFYECKKLESINIPDGVTIINEDTFNGCEALLRVHLNETSKLTAINENAFITCINLADISIPNGVTQIGENAFKNCISLVNLDLSSSLVTIGKSAFYNNGFSEITIPENVTSIAEDTFRGCKDLTKVEFDGISKLKTIGPSAFYNCTNLAEIAFPESLESIESQAFANTALTEITLPEKVVAPQTSGSSAVSPLGSNAFYQCLSLQKIYTSCTNPRTLGPYQSIFAVSSGATASKIQVFVPNKAVYETAWDSSNFANREYEFVSSEFDDGVLKYRIIDAATVAVVGYKETPSSATSVTIPASIKDANGTGYNVTAIADGAFKDCSSLTSIVCLATSAPTLGTDAFPTSVTKIYVPNVGNYASWTDLSEKIFQMATFSFGKNATITPEDQVEVTLNLDNKVACNGFQTQLTLPEGWSLANAVKSGRTAEDSFTFTFNESNGKIILVGTLNPVTDESATKEVCKLTLQAPATFSGDLTVNLTNTILTVSKEDVKIPDTESTVIIPVKITLDHSQLDLKKGKSATLVATITPSFVADKTVTWESFDKEIATVDENGTVKALKAGHATIMAKCGEERTYCRVNVTINEFNDGVLRYEILEDGESVAVIGFVITPSEISQLDIPSEVQDADGKTYTVTGIGNEAFYGCEELKEVTIPATVSEIGDRAFYGCSKLGAVNCFSANPPVIGSQAFYIYSDSYTPKLIIYVFDIDKYDPSKNPESTWTDDKFYLKEDYGLVERNYEFQLLKFEYQGFLYQLVDANSVKVIGYKGEPIDITVPPSAEFYGKAYTVSRIGYGAFENSSTLKAISLPETIQIIEDDAFRSCKLLTSIKLPASLEIIDADAFAFCSGLESVILDDDIKLHKIGHRAFYQCEALTSISLPKNITSIGRWAFQYSGLKSVTFADDIKLTILEAEVFANCKELTEINLPTSVTHIESKAFGECEKLETVRIPESLKEIWNYAFYNCIGLKTIYSQSSNVVKEYYTQEGAFNGVPAENVTVYVPLQLVDAYKNNDEWKNFNIIGENFTAEINGITYELSPETGNAIVIACDPTKTSVEIPTTITDEAGNSYNVSAIADNAFKNCTSLTSVTIPVTVNTIGNDVFANSDVTIYVPAESVETCKEKWTAYADNIKAIPVPATSISIAPETATVDVDKTVTLTVTFTPENTTDKTVTWTSSDETVATVDDGVVTGVAAGTATITATTTNGLIATCSVTVTSPVITEFIYIGISYKVQEDGSVMVLGFAKNPTVSTDLVIPAVAVDGNGKGYVVTSINAFGGCYALKSLTLPASVKTINDYALFSTGLETLTCLGTVVPTIVDNDGNEGAELFITASIREIYVPESAENDYKTNISWKKYEPIINPKAPSVAVTGISISNTVLSLTGGETATLTATITPENATDKTVTWTSSDAAVATVADGVVTGVAAGSATITASSSNGKSATCSVTVIGAGTTFTVGNFTYEILSMPNGDTPGTVSVIGCALADGETTITLSSSATFEDLNLNFTVSKLTAELNSCPGLTSVTIPATLTEIADNVFDGCSTLSEIKVDAGNTVYSSTADGLLLSKDAKTLIKCPAGKTSVPIPESVEKIGADAFSGCSRIESMSIPEKVNEIGANAFSGCSNLKTITVECQEAPTIADSSFSGISADAKIYVPSEAAYEAWKSSDLNIIVLVTGITLQYNGSALASDAEVSITVNEEAQLSAIITPSDATDKTVSWSSSDATVATVDATGKVTAVKAGSATITAKSVNGKTATCTVTVTVPAPKDTFDVEGITYKVDAETGNATVIACDPTKTSIEIPAVVKDEAGNSYNVTIIGEAAFKDCSSLTSVIVPESVTEIKKNAFYNCTSLKTVTFNSTVPPVLGEAIFCQSNDGGEDFVIKALDAIYVPNLDAYTCKNDLENWDAYKPYIRQIEFADLEIGDVISTDGLKYKIITLPKGDQPGEVSLTGPGEDFDGKTLTIEDTVCYLGGEFIIKDIADNSFKDSSDLTTVVSTPTENIPEMGKDVFENKDNINIYVPEESIEAYKKKWPEYADRIKSDTFEVDGIIYKITSEGKVSVIGCNPDKERVNIYASVTNEEGETFDITAFAKDAFENCENLTQIVIMTEEVPTLPDGSNPFPEDTKIYVPDPKQFESDNKDVDNEVRGYVTIDNPEEEKDFSQDDNSFILEVDVVVDSKLDWDSSREKVASVDDTGKVTMNYIGTTTIKVSCDDGLFSDSYELTINPKKGDANWDGKLEVTDAVNIANFVLRKHNVDAIVNWNAGGNWGVEGTDWTRAEWNGFYDISSDINGDPGITVGDAVAAIALVLDQPAAPAAVPRKSPALVDASSPSDALVIGKIASVRSDGALVPVKLDNSMNYVAMQADIHVADGMAITDVKPGKRVVNHKLSSRRIDAQTMRVVLFDLGNSAFADNDEALLEIIVDGELAGAGEIEISNIVASDSSSESHYLTTRGGAEDTNSVESISGNKISIRSSANGLLIGNANGKNVMICTIDGAIVKSFVATSDAETISLSQGIYIVSTEGINTKIVIK